MPVKQYTDDSLHHNKTKTNQSESVLDVLIRSFYLVHIKMTTNSGSYKQWRQGFVTHDCNTVASQRATQTLFLLNILKQQCLLSTGNPFNSNGTAFAYTSSSCFDPALLVLPSVGMNRKSPEGRKLRKK